MIPDSGRRCFRRSAPLGRRVIVGLVCLTWLSLPAAAFAVGGKSAADAPNVADTRDMEPGLSKWIADVYNQDLWLYGLLVVAVMAVMGLAAGLVMDRLVSLLGIDLGRLEHRE